MYLEEKTEYQNHPFIIAIIEALTGGLTIGRDSLALTDELPAGAIIGADANGVGRVINTGAVTATATNSATAYRVPKNSGFKVGQFVAHEVMTGASVAIASINTSVAEYDTITTSVTMGVVFAIGDVVVQTAAAAAAGSAAYAVEPIGLTLTTADLTKANRGVGVLVRGSVSSENLPFPVTAGIKAKLNLIRFE